MSDGTILSWEEAQRLMLPPNSTMLVPPIDAPEVPVLAAAPPRPDWLDDAYVADPKVQPHDSAAEQAAAERAEYGPGPVRLLANLIAVNAVLEVALTPRRKEEKAPRDLPPEPRPDHP
ncbi:MAG: hypothetical protein ACJ8F7_03900 [Gemmataceae bacterium]